MDTIAGLTELSAIIGGIAPEWLLACPQTAGKFP